MLNDDFRMLIFEGKPGKKRQLATKEILFVVTMVVFNQVSHNAKKPGQGFWSCPGF